MENLLVFAQTLSKLLKPKINLLLDRTLYRAQIEHDFDRALSQVHEAYQNIPEEEIEADIALALSEVRAEYAMRESR